MVTKLSDNFDLILKDDWLDKHRDDWLVVNYIDYKSGAFILHKGNKKSSSLDKTLLAIQFNRAIKKICQPLLVHLKKIDDDGPSEDPSMRKPSEDPLMREPLEDPK